MIDKSYQPFGVQRGVGSGWPSAWFGGWTGGTLSSLQSAVGYGQDDVFHDPLAQHFYIYACLKARARAISSTPLKIWSREGDDAPEVTSGDLYRRLRKPHPLLNSAKLWALTSLFWDLDGECYWLLYDMEGGEMKPFQAGLADDIGVPLEIMPVPGRTITVHYNEQTKLPDSFVYSSGAGTESFPPGSVVPFIDIGHQSPMRGLSGTEALRRRLMADFAAETLDIRAAENGGRPSVWLSTEQLLAEPQIDQIEARIKRRSNDPDGHNSPALLHGGLGLQDPGWSPRDMENREMRLLSREGIMAVFGVTKPILGITDDVNRANSHEAHAVFWKDVIVPQQQIFEAALRDSFLSRLIEGRGEYVAAFDRTGIEALQESLDEKIERTVLLKNELGLTPNKAAELAGWEIDPLTDEDFDKPEPPPEELAPEAEEEPDSGEEPNERQARSAVVRTASPREAFDKLLERGERRLAATVAPQHRRYLEAVKTKLRQVSTRAFRPKAPEIVARADGELPPEVEAELERALFPALQAWVARISTEVEPVLAQIYFEAVKQMAVELGIDRIVPDTDVNAIAFLSIKSIDIAEGPLSTLAEQTRRDIAQVMLADGDFTIAQLSDRILATFEELEDQVDLQIAQLPVRADRIARTEAAAVANRGRIAEMLLAGVTEHRWDHSPSPDERGSHAALHGKRASIGDEFAPGLRWPQDDNADVSDVVNCRCMTIPIDDDIEALLDEDPVQ